MDKRKLGRTDIEIEPVIFGCNVLGWTLEENEAFRVLDAFVDHGLTAFDTADSYGKGKSETILGRWMKARGNRDKVVVMTKVGSDMGQGKRDLTAKWIAEEVDNSLKRLQTDVIDLYQSHWPDPETPQEETLGAFDKLVKAGKVRWLGSTTATASAECSRCASRTAFQASAISRWPAASSAASTVAPPTRTSRRAARTSSANTSILGANASSRRSTR